MLNPNLSIAVAESHRRELIEQAQRVRVLDESPKGGVKTSSSSEGSRRRSIVARPLRAAFQRSHAR